MTTPKPSKRDEMAKTLVGSADEIPAFEAGWDAALTHAPEVIELVEAHERTAQIVRGLIGRLSTEGLKNPSTYDSHLFLVELVNCCKRSEKALSSWQALKGEG